jgi:hypothetical protein
VTAGRFKALHCAEFAEWLASILVKHLPELDPATVPFDEHNAVKLTPGSTAPYTAMNLQTAYKFSDALQETAKLRGEPERPHSFFYFGDGVGGVLDFILFTSGKLRVAPVPVPAIPSAFLVEHKAFPSAVFASDHIAQVADLAWV